VIAVLIAGFAALRPMDGHTRTAGAAAASRATVLQVVHGRTRTGLILRRGRQRLTMLALRAGQAIVTADGRPLSSGSVLSGDQMQLLASGSVVDSSQRSADLRGIVLFAPDPAAGALALAVPGAGGILVDTGRLTAFRDPSGKTSSLTELAEADVVQVHGVLDRAAGQMTETDSVTRLGP
jgi:hypothetical protein